MAKSLEALSAKTAEQTAAFNTLTEGAARERAEAGAAVAKLEQQLAEKETERATAFADRLKELSDAFATYDTERRSEAKMLMDDLERQRSEAARIVQVVGNTGITGNYQKIANSESKEANS